MRLPIYTTRLEVVDSDENAMRCGIVLLMLGAFNFISPATLTLSQAKTVPYRLSNLMLLALKTNNGVH